jgi:hypothetical protein
MPGLSEVGTNAGCQVCDTPIHTIHHSKQPHSRSLYLLFFYPLAFTSTFSFPYLCYFFCSFPFFLGPCTLSPFLFYLSFILSSLLFSVPLSHFTSFLFIIPFLFSSSFFLFLSPLLSSIFYCNSNHTSSNKVTLTRQQHIVNLDLSTLYLSPSRKSTVPCPPSILVYTPSY